MLGCPIFDEGNKNPAGLGSCLAMHAMKYLFKPIRWKVHDISIHDGKCPIIKIHKKM